MPRLPPEDLGGDGPRVDLFLFLQQFAQAVEPSLPQAAALLYPFFQWSQSLRFHAAHANASGLHRANQAAPFEYLYVLHHRRERDVEWLREC